MQYQIVIARYNENINYLLKYSNISIVYNKGDNNIPLRFNYINLPNIGRESHTYLYHIIQNYENLANKTLFIQGNIKDHKLYPLDDYLYNNLDFFGKKSIHKIDFLKINIIHKGKYLKELQNSNLKKSKYTPYQWINIIGIDISDIDSFEMIWGANFSVSKDLIYKKPKIFYENLMRYLEYDKNPEEGHFFERSWNLIFNHNIFIKKKIILYSFFNTNILNNLNKLDNILNFENIEEIHIWNTDIIDKNKFFNIKYINNFNYISINPNIINKLFSFKINNNLNILLIFKNNKYEFSFELIKKKIKILNYETNNIISIIKVNNYFEKYIVNWNNKLLILNQNNNNIFNISIIDDELIDIYIKSDIGTIFEYDTFNNKKKNIYNMISNNYIDNDFYRNNFENYYIQDLTKYMCLL